jgi:hypothetical protein
MAALYMKARAPAQKPGGLSAKGAVSPIQINPSKTKPSQIKPSKIAWFYLVLFVRIGTFQWVTTNPNKNFLPASPPPEKRSARRAFVFRQSGEDSTGSGFAKEIVLKNWRSSIATSHPVS